MSFVIIKHFKNHKMTLRILLMSLLPLLSFAQSNSKVAMPKNTQSNDKGHVELKRNALYNLDEIKVRWKKAALENCPGVPCVVTPSFTCGTSTVTDVDGNVYNTVSIGTQCWTKQNLKVSKYNDGTSIPLNNTYTSGSVSTVWQGLTTGAYTIYDNEASSGTNATNYGFLYNWYASKGITTTGSTSYKNLCPTGYHVPKDSDWNKLVKFIDSGADTTINGSTSTSAGTKLKKNDALWTTNIGTDDFGFSALPGGYRWPDGRFDYVRDEATFWSATQFASSLAWQFSLVDSPGDAYRGFSSKSYGSSVRCLRD